MLALALALALALPAAAPVVPMGLTDLDLIDASGARVDPDYRGRVIVVDAWATWCAPCLAELPRLRQLVRRHGDELVLVGLSVDRMPRRDFISWLQRKDVTWPQHFDGRGYDSPAARAFAIDAIPETWLFDREGRLVARGLRGATLEAAVDLLVAGGRR